MHPAWHIDDVRDSIFQYLSSQDLARLAQTGRALFGIATDALWKSVHELKKLWHCLPPESKYRSIQPEDLQRLKFYCSKIHSIRIDQRGGYRFGSTSTIKNGEKQSETRREKTWEQMWKEVRVHFRNTELFPNLRVVDVHRGSPEAVYPLIGNFGSAVTHLHLFFYHGNRVENPSEYLLKDLHEAAHLEYLLAVDCDTIVSSRLIQQSTLRFLELRPRYCNDSRPVRLDILSSATLEHLAIPLTRKWYTSELQSLMGQCLPRLKALRLKLWAFEPKYCDAACTNVSSDSWTCKEPARINLFHNPGCIKRKKRPPPPSSRPVHDCGCRPPTLFFPLLAQPSLKFLHLQLPRKAIGRTLQSIMASVSEHCRPSNLDELALSGSGFSNWCSRCGVKPVPKISPDDLRKGLQMLFPLTNLTILRLKLASSLLDVYDDDLYRELAEGMPALRHLHLGYRASQNGGQFRPFPDVSLHHLAAFCSLLPCLEAVSVRTMDLYIHQPLNPEWMSPNVTSLVIEYWFDLRHKWDEQFEFLGLPEGKLDHLGEALDMYFPALSDTSRRELFEPFYSSIEARHQYEEMIRRTLAEFR